MKKILFGFLVGALLIGCNTKTGISKKDVVGNYKATLQMDSVPGGGSPEGLKAMIAMMASAQINYQFKEDGSGIYSVKMGAMGNQADIKWELLGQDSLKINVKDRAEVYNLKKTATGLVLGTGKGLSLALTKE